jgi:hypothetical protein
MERGRCRESGREGKREGGAGLGEKKRQRSVDMALNPKP